MISGYLQDKLIAQSTIQEVNGTDMLATLERRTTKIYMGGQSQQQLNPLDLVQISSALPQFSLQQNIDPRLQNLLNSNYQQQISQLASYPNIDLINQVKEQAKVVRMHYQA
ncbi:unnamed protein product [Paramecium pentaurelia]|uniref:Uncharacterized protein n=1 Tax=Paramecium pentaurelia TaxID=43138 RepID=A0A8S1SX84_9CILI|nr:unnamed protein product [Paramecium pentaurelia]